VSSILVFAVAYYIAYKYGTFFLDPLPSPFWTPDAVLLSALLLSPTRYWWIFIIATLPIRLITNPQGNASWFLLATYGNDVVKALFTATVLRRVVKASPRLASLREFSLFFACGVILAPALSAFGGAATLYARSGDPHWHSWLNWFLGDALVNLVLTPTILYWWTGGLSSLWHASVLRRAEAILLMAALILIGIKVIGGELGGPSNDPVLLYIPMPFLLWAAVRFGPRGASTSLTAMALLTIWDAVERRGIFGEQSAEQNLLSLQLFLIAVSTPLLFLAVMVQARRDAEESLRQSEGRYRQIFERNLAVQWLVDASSGTIIAANPAASKFYGYSPEQLERMKVTDINILPAEQTLGALQRALAGQGNYLNFRHRLASGDVRDVEVYSTPADADGQPLLYQIIHDVTERRQTEERLRRFFDLPMVGMAITSPDRRFTVVNQKLCDILGYPADQLTGMRWVDVTHPDDVAENVRLLDRTLSGETDGYTMDKRFIHRDGNHVYTSISARAVRSDDGTVDHLVLIVQDITERKKAEHSLKEALDKVRELKDQLYNENVYLQEAIMVAHDFGEIVGNSQSLRRALQQGEQVAALDTTVLILGETGTGKELLAHAIHNLSGRKNRSLIKVNCATLHSHLIEDELFGHEKGAFTGALARRVGRFEIADGGTIFLDEIGELPLDLQAKLLRIIQEGEFERLGGSRTIKVDVRLIAATNRDLEAAVRSGAFRADLFYRLSVYPIIVPPLRERKEDIAPLVMHFVKQLNTKLGKQIESIPQRSLDALTGYPWPGNIRELRNVLERAAIITRGTTLQLLDSLESERLDRTGKNGGRPNDGPPHSSLTLEECERALILRTLERTGGRIEGSSGAANILAINPSTLRSRMRKLGITRSMAYGRTQ
jgi:PAS domain S-box-containing protein